MFGASNELPDEDELTALYDRFLLRFMVDYIGEDFRFLKMLEGDAASRAHHAQLRRARRVARADPRGRSAGQRAAPPSPSCGASSDASRSVASDRRWRSSLDVLRAHAFLCGRAIVTEDDLGFLEHVLWKDPEEHPKVRDATASAGQGLRGARRASC